MTYKPVLQIIGNARKRGERLKKSSAPGPMSSPKPDVILLSEFLKREEADTLLGRIRSDADFQQNYIQCYGRKAVPRLEAWYAPWDYAYSKGVVLKAAAMPNYLQEVIDRIRAAGLGDFN